MMKGLHHCFAVEFADGSTSIEAINSDELRNGSDHVARIIIYQRLVREARDLGEPAPVIKSVTRTACPR